MTYLPKFSQWLVNNDRLASVSCLIASEALTQFRKGLYLQDPHVITRCPAGLTAHPDFHTLYVIRNNFHERKTLIFL